MNFLSLTGTMIALSPASQAGAATSVNVMPGERRQHLVTVTFDDPATARFGLELYVRSIFIEWEDWEKKIPSGIWDWETDTGYVILHDGVIDSFLSQTAPTYPYDGPVHWSILNPRFSGNKLTFWARTPYRGFKAGMTKCYGPGWERCFITQQWVQTESWSIGPGATISFSRESAVPEPAAWALMIAGFGLVGSALRARRRQDAVGIA